MQTRNALIRIKPHACAGKTTAAARRSIVFLLFLAAVMLAPLCLPAPAQNFPDEAEVPVRVGIFTGDGYAELDHEGRWQGIDIEMIENIAQTGNMQVTFVEAKSANEGLKWLESGSIDILADIAKTKERESRFLFSEYEQGNVGTNIFVLQNDSRWSYGDTEQFKKMKFGNERDNIAGSDFRGWCTRHGFSPDITEYSSLEDAFAAVRAGKLDACIDGEDYVHGFRSVLSFAPSPYYFVFAKNNVKLKARVDEAMAQIFIQDPLYEQELLEKYVGLTSGRDTALTKEEKAFIAASPDVRVAVLRDDEPYFYGSAAAPAGMIPEFYQRIAAVTGLRFHFQVYDDQELAIAAVKDHRADLIGVFSSGLIQAYAAGLNLTRKYTAVNAVIITRAGTDLDTVRNVAVKGRSEAAVRQALSGTLNKAALLPFNTAEECFHALEDKRADAVIIGLPSATYLINQTNSAAYTITPGFSVTLELCAATRHGNSLLTSIMNKGINAAAFAINGIIAKNTVSRNTLESLVSRIPATLIVIFAVLMLLIVAVLCWAVVALARSRRNEVAAVQAEAKAEEQRIRAEAAEKSAAEKNSFFSTISHDMRTPLNAVIGFAGLARQESGSAKKDEYLSKIQISGELLNSLINDTLTIAKANSGKLELKLEPVDTNRLTRDIAESVRAAAEQKGVCFTTDDAGLRRRTVLADKLNISKIFLNLLSNAVKFTPAGGHVSYSVCDDPGGAADAAMVFKVSDDGIGMSAEYMQRMFEPFSQEQRRGYEALGTGLGLSIVKKMVELMGGTIEVQSRPNHGTTFTVRLHLKEVAAVATTDGQETAAAPVELSGKKVLLCEDNELNREIAVLLLQGKGISAVSAENGVVGLKLFAQSAPGEFAAVLMDIRMPVMDGYEAVKALRALARPDAKAVPVIAMTADAFDDDVQKCLASGMNGHIAKPIEPAKFYAVLASLIR